jgi:hypothetical protein
MSSPRRQTRLAARPWLVAALALLLNACAGSGEGLDAGGRPIGENPPPPPDGRATFRAIQDTIFTPICTQCHEGATAPQGLRLDAANSYAQLVNVASAEVPSLLRVDPGDPDASYLVQKIDGRASVGARMPLGGPDLTQAQIDLVREWIAAGAAQATAATTDAFAVVAALPEQDEVAASVETLQIVFNAAVDTSLAGAGAFELIASGGDDGFADANERSVAFARIDVALGNPTVVTLHTAAPLTPDRYRLRVRGDGPAPLADVDARVLDGDGDGRSGGVYSSEFTVEGRPP